MHYFADWYGCVLSATSSPLKIMVVVISRDPVVVRFARAGPLRGQVSVLWNRTYSPRAWNWLEPFPGAEILVRGPARIVRDLKPSDTGIRVTRLKFSWSDI